MPIIKYITDFSDDNLLPYKGLAIKSSPVYGDYFIAETRIVIQNALEAGCTPLSFLVSEKYIEGRDKDLLQRFSKVPVYTASDEVLKQLTGFRLTRGILSVMSRPEIRSDAELIKRSSLIVVLENVQDASNIGAIIRSACGLGVDGILLDHSCCDPLHRKAVRTSTGSVFRIPWARSEKAGATLADDLTKAGFSTYAFALTSNAIPLQNVHFSLNERIALFFGSEGNGLDIQTIENCMQAVIIPMHNNTDSLNIASAATIAIWECCRNR